MTPHVWYVIAFILFTAATIAAASDKQHPLAVTAAGLACWVLPLAFQLHN